MEETPKRIPYEWVRNSMLKAGAKYRRKNREAYNQKQKQYYDAHKNDEEYMQKMRKKAFEYYHRKKAERQKQEESQALVL